MSKHKSKSSNKSRSSRKGKTSKRHTSSSKRVSSIENSAVRQNINTTNNRSPISKSGRTPDSLSGTGNVNRQRAATGNVSQERRMVNTTPTSNRQRVASRNCCKYTNISKKYSAFEPKSWIVVYQISTSDSDLYFVLFCYIYNHNGLFRPGI